MKEAINLTNSYELLKREKQKKLKFETALNISIIIGLALIVKLLVIVIVGEG